MLGDSQTLKSVFDTIGVGGVALFLAGVGAYAIAERVVARYRKPKYDAKFVTPGQLLEAVANYSATTTNLMRSMSESQKERDDDMKEIMRHLETSIDRLAGNISELRVELAKKR